MSHSKLWNWEIELGNRVCTSGMLFAIVSTVVIVPRAIRYHCLYPCVQKQQYNMNALHIAPKKIKSHLEIHEIGTEHLRF